MRGPDAEELVSGELLLRSRVSLSIHSKRTLDRIEAARLAVRSRARARRELADVSRRRAAASAAAARREARLGEARLRSLLDAASAGLDAQLAALVLRYGGALAAERRRAFRRAKHAARKCETEALGLALRERVDHFALHVDHETQGAVRVNRLEPSDAQHARCARAAAENVRRGFFSEGWEHKGLEVVDVYKIENRVLLDQFQRLSEATKQTPGAAAEGKPQKLVKGLFCSVPTECLERLVVYGVRGDGARRGLDVALFDDAAAQKHDDEEDDDDPEDGNPVGVARRAAQRRSAAVPFPCEFSRYSTLEDLRALAERGGSGAGSLRLLALCRVIVGKVKMLKDDLGLARDDSRDAAAYDSTFSPRTESYRPLKAEHVLPEFIVVYKLNAPASAAGGEAATPATSEKNAPRVSPVLEALRAALRRTDGGGADLPSPRASRQAPAAVAAAAPYAFAAALGTAGAKLDAPPSQGGETPEGALLEKRDILEAIDALLRRARHKHKPKLSILT
ncbi:hypothetical protein M885DRAFT_610008 [Pelagophyceae sp. CCMP2097]|nr:hypothetical protein M885DRAFT_610008 [Pelagophyceae sp. CCMP2097]